MSESSALFGGSIAENYHRCFSDVHLSVLRRESRAPSARDVAMEFVAELPA